MPDRPRVAVVGGGIAGLSTAWFLSRRSGPAPPRVTLLDESGRFGGKVHTEELAGVPVEAGPDTFLARVPWAADLCREAGLGEELVAPATAKAYVWARGRLRPLPEGLVLGVPTALTPLLRSGILPPSGLARAALEVVLPRTRFPGDPSVADVVGARLGHTALDGLVEPLIGGINAGRADRLSLAATAPQLAEASESHRSLVLGLRRERRRPPDAGPLFLGLEGGLVRLIERLTAGLDGVELRPGTRVRGVDRGSVGYRLSCVPGPDVTADAVVLAVPAYAAAGMVRSASPDAAAELDRIDYASVVVATLGFRPDAVGRTLDGSGFLVPRPERWLTTACTWSTTKWPALRRSGLVLLRASAGRFGDERALELDDDTLLSRLHEELDRAVGISEPPVATLVTRWPRSFPQYEPGHAARVNRIETALAELPGVFLTGAAYRGLGIASCVRDAEQTARRILRS